ncbi:MAG: PQQ-binding-like beta-propeller repeat protein, partial [bacterium]|nr:PQQ-binding-like beta-propeller repeat protein [bacterium]
MRKLGLLTLLSTTLLLAASLDAAEVWPRFRGPNAGGVARDSEPPVEFGPEKNVAWKTLVPPGVSSPVVTDQRIFLTAAEDDRLLTFALDRATGKILWRRSVTKNRDERKHRLNNSAAATPVTDGENVYLFFGEFGLISYGADGQERWRVRLGPFNNLHGMASSPMLAGDKLILLCDQDVGSYLLAVDKNTGKQMWKTPRPEAVHGFSTPTLFEPADDVPQLVVPGSYQLTSYGVDSGERLWWVRGISWQIKPVAVVDANTVYATGWAPGADAGNRRFFPPFSKVIEDADADGDGKLLAEEIPEEMRHTGSWQAIDLDHDGFMDARDWSFYRARWSSRNVTLAVRPQAKRGDLTDTSVLWTYKKAVPVVSSPLLYRGSLYTIKDGGILTVLDAQTGKLLHQGRLRD